MTAQSGGKRGADLCEGLDNKPLEPYRVQWRPDLTTNWGAQRDAANHDEAQEVAQSMRDEFGGQTRIVVQHVTEVSGLAKRGTYLRYYPGVF